MIDGLTPNRTILLIALGAAALSSVAAGAGTLPGDIAIQRFVQEAPQPPARWLADFGNWIGSSRVFAVIAVTLAGSLLVARRPWESGLMVGVLAARAINGLLKMLFDSPRPAPDLVRVTELAGGLGFPSGHAMGSMLGYGGIALVTGSLVTDAGRRRTIQSACVALICLVGFGRVFVGAHWPSDVLGGYLWGGLILALLHAAWRVLRSRMET